MSKININDTKFYKESFIMIDINTSKSAIMKPLYEKFLISSV